MVGLLHAMAFMVLLLIGWVIWNNKPLPLPVKQLLSPWKQNQEQAFNVDELICALSCIEL